MGERPVKWIPSDIEESRARSERDLRVLRFVRESGGLIANVRTRLRVLDDGTHWWPVSVNDAEPDQPNCYVVSPRAAYGAYADYEIQHLVTPVLAWPLRALAAGMDLWFRRARLDQVVQVNNWLVSTNVYPDGWDGARLAEITAFLRAEYPDHAIVFRSLNPISTGSQIEALQALGYLALASRQVYLYDGRAGDAAEFLRRHNNRIDTALWRRTDYRLDSGADLSPAEYARAEQLYNLLYLEKYSPLNPQFTAGWLACGVRDGWLELLVLRDRSGRIDGVVGWFGESEWFTAPVVGYDTTLPASAGLYRLITNLCFRETARRGCRLNFSSGAAGFKRLRGGEAAIEYMLTDVTHLSARRRRVWRLLRWITDVVVVPLMVRWQL